MKRPPVFLQSGGSCLSTIVLTILQFRFIKIVDDGSVSRKYFCQEFTLGISIALMSPKQCTHQQKFRGTQRFVSGNICSEGLKSPEIFGFNCSKSQRFLWRNITPNFRNKRTYLFLLFSEGQVCRSKCKIRSVNIFGQPSAARKFGG